MSNRNRIAPYTLVLRLARLLTLLLFVAFTLYVASEKQVDRVNERRLASVLVAEELRHSSDDLTRTVRAYVETGKLRYKQQYQDILAIRDGKQPRRAPLGAIYWDLLPLPAELPKPLEGPSLPLLEHARQAGFNEQELQEFALAKLRSDALAQVELEAMAIIESHPRGDSARERARASLYDESYQLAKAEIMVHIDRSYRLMDQRTAAELHEAELRARALSVVLLALGLALLGALSYAFHLLGRTLGTDIGTIAAEIERIGQGDFSHSITVPPGRSESVIGWLAQMLARLRDADTSRAETLGRQRREQQLAALRAAMMERLSSSATLDDVLEDYALEIEAALPGVMCSILLLSDDGQHLRMGAAPSLPADYNAAIDGVRIGPAVGSCGTAAYTRQRVVVEQISTHPYWAAFKDLAARAGLAACWSEPIRSGADTVLGTFALYSRRPASPNDYDIAIIELAANLTALAIERKRAELQLQLLAKVFEHGSEVIMITDARARLVRVNQAFTAVTGYTEAEALGRNPAMLSSGRHGADFFRQMWDCIDRDGHWSGEVWNRRKDGSLYPEWLSISVLYDPRGAVSNYVAIATDITQRKAAEERIRQLADFDALTGLPNRRLLQDRINTLLQHARRHQQPLALLFLDLDRFKNVNDSLGHHVGDQLLVAVARRLVEALRDEDTVSRIGGDEFVILCPETDVSGAAHVARKLIAALQARFDVEDNELAISCSIGIATYPGDGDSDQALTRAADTAMYRAKKAGRSTFCYYAAEMQAQTARLLALENALRRALELEQLHLEYQPQLSLTSGQLVGAEALLRWTHPELGAISPAEFIPLAEDSGLIVAIGDWVLRSACRQMRAWLDAGLALEHVAVNLSVVQFRQPGLAERVQQVLRDSALDARHLELEVTESVAMNNPQEMAETLGQLQALGVAIAIDDFGTGYSSMAYLKKFRPQRLKIDRSFVRDLVDDGDDRAIVGAIVGLGRSLGFASIAEGVETDEQLEILQRQGCEAVQGYLISRPLPPAALESFARAQQREQPRRA
jgi:diguanylate cyclase (GGDEF)-like protein/PAS domain S-box-containing protein